MLYPNQATRLLGRGPNSKARLERPASTIEGAAWAGAAAYLAGRLQVSGEEVGNTPGHERRKADMSPAAGAAMCDVLAEMGREGAQHEAANKLITNHERVLRDLCRADGPPASQPELARLPGQEREVNIFMREATRRLREATQPGQRTRQPTRAEGSTWAGAAAYLAGRLQVSEEEVRHVPGHEGRKADMSPAAGAAMRAVLAEMGKEGADVAEGLYMPQSSFRRRNSFSEEMGDKLEQWREEKLGVKSTFRASSENGIHRGSNQHYLTITMHSRAATICMRSCSPTHSRLRHYVPRRP